MSDMEESCPSPILMGQSHGLWGSPIYFLHHEKQGRPQQGTRNRAQVPAQFDIMAEYRAAHGEALDLPHIVVAHVLGHGNLPFSKTHLPSHSPYHAYADRRN